MHEYFTHKKPLIARELAGILAGMQPDLSRVNKWAEDASDRLLAFAVQGKMVRGGLLVLAYEMFDGKEAASGKEAAAHSRSSGGAASAPLNPRAPRPIIKAAAAMEVIHSALLIHDDIMDNDRLRRGFRTIFAQYESIGTRCRACDPERFGRSMGICAGDIGFFIASDIVSKLKLPPDRKLALQALLARELTYVGLAQMQDVSFGAFARTPPVHDVYTLYLYKTARYTFSLPLMAGALLAGKKGQTLSRLAELGEYLGVAFQARDDEIGVFGTERETGKPVGSDIREGKKTLLYLELLRRARGAERRKLESIFGKHTLEPSEVALVRSAIERSGARKRMQEMMQELAARAEKLIESLHIPEGYRTILREISAIGMRRSR
jgi:geranylgeranyl diphosphate synthase type I